MCESIADGGRRCPCNAPHARAARRKARLAKNDAPEGGIGAGGTQAATTAGAAALPETWDVPALQAYADVLSSAASGDPLTGEDGALLTGEQMRAGVGSQGIAFTDEEIACQEAWVAVGGTRARLEQSVTALGERVADEAERRSGTGIADIAATHKAALEEAEAADAQADAEVRQARQKMEQTPEMLAAQEADKAAQERGTDYAYRKANRLSKLATQTEAYKEWSEAADRAHAAHQRLSDVKTWKMPQVQEKLLSLRRAYGEVLTELRPFGGEADVHHGSTPGVEKSLASVASRYPTDWIDRHNENGQRRGPLIVRAHQRRAFYVSTGDGTTATVHRPLVDKHTVSEQIEEVDRPEVSYSRERSQDLAFLRSMVAEADDPEIAERAGDLAERVHVHHYDVEVRDEGEAAPAGPQWTRYEGVAQQEGKTIWRRPKTRAEEATPPSMTISPSVEKTTGKTNHRRAFTHEMAHRFEDVVPGIKRLEHEFLTRRTTRPDGSRLEPVDALNGSGMPAEGDRDAYQARPDSFADMYMSREYSDGSREIMSTGMESLFSGSYGGLVGAEKYPADPDMRAFVLGTLASVGRTPRQD